MARPFPFSKLKMIVAVLISPPIPREALVPRPLCISSALWPNACSLRETASQAFLETALKATHQTAERKNFSSMDLGSVVGPANLADIDGGTGESKVHTCADEASEEVLP